MHGASHAFASESLLSISSTNLCSSVTISISARPFSCITPHVRSKAVLKSSCDERRGLSKWGTKGLALELSQGTYSGAFTWSSQRSTFSMSCGIGEPVHWYTACWSTLSKAMEVDWSILMHFRMSPPPRLTQASIPPSERFTCRRKWFAKHSQAATWTISCWNQCM